MSNCVWKFRVLSASLFAISVYTTIIMLAGLPAAFGQNRELVPYVGDASFCNVPTYQRKNPSIASVTRYRGQYIIIIDPDVRSDERWLKFVIAHECGHVKNGHLNFNHSVASRTIDGFIKKRELEADCWAARHAPRRAVEYAFFYFRDKVKRSHPSYPTGKQRAENLRKCAGF